MKRKKMLIVLLSVLLSLTLAVGASAGDWHGYAVYRDGVIKQGILNLNWHAGLMDEATKNHNLPVTHIGGLGQQVKYASWSEFIDGNNYKGIYRPKTTPNAAAYDSFVTMGRKLKNNNIPYSFMYQVNYDLNNVSNWVYPEQVTGIRCDGVVEYCYEWNNYRVYGSGDNWDVTKPSATIRGIHYIDSIQPQKQAQNYLTWCGNLLPT